MGGFAVIAVTTWPWEARFSWALLKQIPQLLGPVSGVVSIFVTLAAVSGVWLLGKYDVKRTLKSILTVVVIIVSVGVTAWVSYEMRTQVAEEAANRSEEAYNLAITEFDKTKENRNSGNQDARTSALINMDQAIAKITSQIYLVVYYRFPEVQLRSISVHLLRPVALGKISGDILNIVQEGRSEKDMPVLSLSDSFIGYTIQQDTEQYCPDVQLKEDPECLHYKRSSRPVPSYVSLLCHPLGEASPEAKSSAGICFDSKSPRAFDNGEKARLIEALMPQLDHLSDLLSHYRNLLTQELSVPQSTATLPWLPPGTI